MKKLLILIVLALTSVTMASDPNLCIIGRAAIGNPSVEAGLNLDGMLGIKRDIAEDIAGEIGGIVNYNGNEAAYGGYGLLHYTGELAIPNPLKDMADWMPETVLAKPFAGGGWMDRTGSFWTVGSTVFDCIELYYREDIGQSRQNFVGVTLKLWEF